PGYEQIAKIGRTKEEFHVDGRVRHEPVFPFPDGRARFIPVDSPKDDLLPNELRLMTIRSEGQFNTVVYEESDRYRNQSARDVILLNAGDIERLGLHDGERIAVRSSVGEMRGIRVAVYDIALGSAAMYYPEANLLVGTGVDPKSGTPAYKNVRVVLEKSNGR
ncbi:MAG: molybdopterin dinucleotide binding domain-containing protein, partial [Bacteroidota bacterium]